MIQSFNTQKVLPHSFSISTKEFGSLTAYVLSNENTGESATIVPALGAMLNSLSLKKGTSLFEIIDGSKTELEAKEDGTKMYKSRILFPYPNRIKQGLYIFEGKMYKFETDNEDNSLHGFCENAKFNILSQDTKKTKASLTISYALDGKHTAYPFEISLTVVYELSKKGLSIWTEIKNIGTKTAPAGLGWHPYFKTGSKIDELQLWFPAHHNLPVDEQMIPTGKKSEGFAFAGFETLEEIFLDNGYKLDAEIKYSTLKIKDPLKDITINIVLQNGYDYLQVFTPSHRNSIAIEPQTCAADAFNNKMGLVELKSGEKRIFHFSISLT
jgi:aldose 1-epimerase